MKRLKFEEWVKMKKSPFKQSKPSGVRDMESDLSKDFKGHLEKLGTIEPFKLKETTEYVFDYGDRVCLRHQFKLGEIVGCVPGGGGGSGYYYVRWDGETEEAGPYQEEDLEAAR